MQSRWTLLAILAVAAACSQAEPPPPRDCAASCGANATCSEAGTCVCISGYTGDGHDCADIDECDAPTPVCGIGGQCTNEPGGYTCACEAGFEQTGDGTCADLDECTTPDICPSGGSCTNLVGSYTCACGDEVLSVGSARLGRRHRAARARRIGSVDRDRGRHRV